jgi:hypothetical protein
MGDEGWRMEDIYDLRFTIYGQLNVAPFEGGRGVISPTAQIKKPKANS